MTDQPISFSERRRLLAEQRGVKIEQDEPAAPVIEHTFEEDLIPDVLGDQTDEDIQVDTIIDNIDVLDAYRRWIGKNVDEKTTGLREGIKVSCPKPKHRDNNPSAWLNADKKTWYCGGCEEGGDLYDLAAIKFNMPDYKDGKNFHDLRKEMAESYGYRFKTIAGTEIIWRESDAGADRSVSEGGLGSETSSAPAEADGSDDPAADSGESEPSNVRALNAAAVEEDDEDFDERVVYPHLPWRDLVPEGTFLWEYLEATSRDDSPEEYHFWHGLLALGHAVGRNVFLNDTRPVYGNLLVCLLGGTGFGKSRSRAWLDDLLDDVLPFRDNGLDTSGVKLVVTPGSGEHMISSFEHVAYDPSMPKMPAVIRTPINGIVDFDEFAALLARANRQGSTLKTIIMQFSDSKTRVTSGSNTGGDHEAFKPFCSVTASTQPKAVRTLLSKYDTGSGFLNRWLFIAGPRKKREVMGGVHSSITVSLDAAADKLKFIRGWGGVERDIRFTEDGLAEFERFMQGTVFKIQQSDDTDLLTRLDLTMKRLVLLFCINERKMEADERIVKLVEPLLDYLIRCYSIINDEIGISAMSEITTEIMRHIKRVEEKTGRGMTPRELGQRMKRQNYSPDLIKRALETMVALDWLEMEKGKGPGRPSIRYKSVG